MPLDAHRHTAPCPGTGALWSRNPCSGVKKHLTLGVRPSFWVVGLSLGIAQPPKTSFGRPPPFLMLRGSRRIDSVKPPTHPPYEAGTVVIGSVCQMGETEAQGRDLSHQALTMSENSLPPSTPCCLVSQAQGAILTSPHPSRYTWLTPWRGLGQPDPTEHSCALSEMAPAGRGCQARPLQGQVLVGRDPRGRRASRICSMISPHFSGEETETQVARVWVGSPTPGWGLIL